MAACASHFLNLEILFLHCDIIQKNRKELHLLFENWNVYDLWKKGQKTWEYYKDP